MAIKYSVKLFIRAITLISLLYCSSAASKRASVALDHGNFKVNSCKVSTIGRQATINNITTII